MPLRAWLALARPRLAPFVLLLPVVGFGWAHWDRALPLRGADSLGRVLVAWLLLHAGTLWFNALLDRDDGEVLLGDPVPPPPGTAPLAWGALGASVLVAATVSVAHAAGTSVAAVLAVLYSHRWTAWKAHPVLGPLVNVVGYGLVSTWAGWACAGVSTNPRTVVVWGVGALGVLGATYLAMAFQHDEDRRRGYRTLVATHGPAAALLATRLCFGVGFTVAVGLAAVGWLPRVVLVAGPLGVWVDARLRRWAADADAGRAADAVDVARRLLGSVLVVLLLVFVDYAVESVTGGPVAGLGTVAGHPPDRTPAVRTASPR